MKLTTSLRSIPESLSPTIFMLSLIFFSFSSTMTLSMGGITFEKDMELLIRNYS